LGYVFLLGLSCSVIGSIGGIMGLVLEVVKFPVVMNIESSISIIVGANIGVSILGTIINMKTCYSYCAIHVIKAL